MRSNKAPWLKQLEVMLSNELMRNQLHAKRLLIGSKNTPYLLS